MVDYSKVKETDIEVFSAMQQELSRQQDHLELIASENFVSVAVMQAMGSHLTNKYAEGYPGKRYYGGCEYVDIVEDLARKRACELFGADHANVQPHSGAQANLAVYFSLLSPGDTILGMNLAHGGHLTHGSPVNMSGKYYNIIPYGVTQDTNTIDYNELERLAKEHKPKLIVAGASAYPRTIDFSIFRRIADEVGAIFMVDMAHIAGLCAAGYHENPVKYADIVTTTTHKTLRGPRGGMILCKEQYSAQIDKSIFPGTQGGPLMHIIAAKAVCFKEAMSEEFNNYQGRVVDNAKTLAKSLIDNGINLVSGGTDNHLMLLNLTDKSITGKELEALLGRANITVNKNTIPFETLSPFVTSGIRIGTPAVTSRGLNTQDMEQLGKLIARVVEEREDAIESVRDEVLSICEKYPLY